VSEFTANTAITLAAVADAGSLFGGWNGACTGLGTCVVTLNVSKTVTAVFSQTALPMITVGSQTVVTGPVHFTATLGMSNWDSCTWSFGDGSITNCAAVSAAAGIQSSNLPAVTGSHQYTQSGYYTVSVAATNLAGQFQASIPVTITSANITPPERALHVAMLGNGEGAVKSSPSGIACGASCSADFTADSVVELTAVAQTGSTFTGWSGACTGVRSCNVTMDTERTVTATFDLASQPAIVTNGPTVVTGTVEFTATLGMSNYDRCEWDFGDSSSAACTSNALSAQSSADQPLIVRGSHQYLQSGQYTVTVTAENSAGSFASTTIVAIQPAASTEQSLYLPSVIR